MPTYLLHSNPNELASIERLVDLFVAKKGVKNEIRNRMLVACLEAISNSIYHGNQSNEKKIVKFVLKKQKEFIMVIVEDEGIGFDYNSLADPTLPENILNLDGRGVFLMKKLSDSIRFNDNGNRVELYFKL